MNKQYDIVIAGGGASGLFLASLLKNKKVAVLEKNPKVGRKLQISGGGKCNVTNKILSKENYLGDREFIGQVLEKYTNEDLLNYFRKRDLEFVVRDKYQYFCEKTSSEILRVFKKESKDIEFFTSCEVFEAKKEGELFEIKTSEGIFKTHSFVVASGGLSYQSVGAGGIGYEIAKSFGHTVKQTNPALVGFTVQKDEFWFKELSGISLEGVIRTGQKDVKGNILFTHKGISGPAVLTASVYWEKGKMEIDFLPGFDFKKIENSGKFLSTVLPVPKRFIKAYLENFDIKDKAYKDLTTDEKEQIRKLKSYTFAPAGNFGYTKAEVTKGGVNTNELDPQTMESRLVKDLYFLGEVVDVTGDLGGYNFQWAFSSAYVCSEKLRSEA